MLLSIIVEGATVIPVNEPIGERTAIFAQEVQTIAGKRAHHGSTGECGTTS